MAIHGTSGDTIFSLYDGLVEHVSCSRGSVRIHSEGKYHTYFGIDTNLIVGRHISKCTPIGVLQDKILILSINNEVAFNEIRQYVSCHCNEL